ncbi:MAG TPA: hypothetical protein VFQ45_17595 [Longimicrobium sp.]|nr:hypothetical protein [Longimicrobium sp.]
MPPLMIPAHHEPGPMPPADAPAAASPAPPAPESTDARPHPERSPDVALWLGVAQAIGLLWLIPWAGMLFGDRPTNIGYGVVTESMEIAVALVLLAYPLILAASALFAWLAQRRGRNGRAIVLSLIPLIPILLHLALVDHEDRTDCCAMPTDSDTALVLPTP